MSNRSVMWLGLGLSALLGCTFEIKDDRPAQPLVITVPATIDGAQPASSGDGGGGGTTSGGTGGSGGSTPTGAGGSTGVVVVPPNGTAGTDSPPGSLPREPTGFHVCPPAVSTEFTLRANLDARASIPTIPWDPQNPLYTANFGQSVLILDSLGVRHTISVFFRKTGQGAWEYHALADGDELAPPQPGLSVEVGSGTLAFNTEGALDMFTQATPITLNFAGATAAQAINLVFGTALSWGGTGNDGVTSYGAPALVLQRHADGCQAVFATSCVNRCEPLQQVGSFGEPTRFDLVMVPWSHPGGAPEPSWQWCAPQATTRLRLRGNLDAEAWVPTTPWDSANPLPTSNFSTTLLAFDSLGGQHAIELYFRKTGLRAWEYHVLVGGEELWYPSSYPREIGSGTFSYDESGALQSVTHTVPVGVTFSGARPMVLEIDLGTPRAGGGHGLDGLTQFLGKSNIHSQGVDGCTAFTAPVCPLGCGN